jgi:hypothetical protein
MGKSFFISIFSILHFWNTLPLKMSFLNRVKSFTSISNIVLPF